MDNQCTEHFQLFKKVVESPFSCLLVLPHSIRSIRSIRPGWDTFCLSSQRVLHTVHSPATVGTFASTWSWLTVVRVRTALARRCGCQGAISTESCMTEDRGTVWSWPAWHSLDCDQEEREEEQALHAVRSVWICGE
eukprot:GFUD01097948.1.p1 GENE.GFUD01097948.1~~GFUD01097948.1.p1  ORF type:complete len:136 (+),score=26.84 GFUD01097948.1:308-715(+)